MSGALLFLYRSYWGCVWDYGIIEAQASWSFWRFAAWKSITGKIHWQRILPAMLFL